MSGSVDELVSNERVRRSARVAAALSQYYHQELNLTLPITRVSFQDPEQVPSEIGGPLCIIRNFFASMIDATLDADYAVEDEEFARMYQLDGVQARIRLNPGIPERHDGLEIAFGYGVVTLADTAEWSLEPRVENVPPEHDLKCLLLQMAGNEFMGRAIPFLMKTGYLDLQDGADARKLLEKSLYYKKARELFDKEKVPLETFIANPTFVVMQHPRLFPAIDPTYVPRSPLAK
jgi:hypothetical protein